MDLLTRTAKTYYEELKLQSSKKQIASTLFPTLNEDTSSSFLLDTMVADSYGITYRPADTQSAVRQYQPGSGTLLEVPRSSEKTPLTEKLLDAVAVGIESTDGFGANEAKIVADIVNQHDTAFNMTKNKQALDIFSTGVFSARGKSGADLGLDINYNRKSALTGLTYDFTASGATFIEGIANAQEELRANGTPLGGMFMLAGQNWLSQFSKDTTVQELMQANAVNQIMQSQMIPAEFQGTDGLFVLGQVRGVGMLAPIWVMAYTPGTSYIAYQGASATPFVADDEALFGSWVDTRFHVNRGVDVLDGNGKRERTVGDLVFDTYDEKDPVNTFFRTTTRHAFVPANINHTAKSTGTFA